MGDNGKSLLPNMSRVWKLCSHWAFMTSGRRTMLQFAPEWVSEVLRNREKRKWILTPFS